MSTDSVMNVHGLHHVTPVTGQELCVDAGLIVNERLGF
jgi:hypothetical protein